MIKLLQDTNKTLSPIFEDLLGVTPKKFVIVSALVAISFVGLGFAFGVPHSFILFEVVLAIDFVALFYATRIAILVKTVLQRQKLEDQKLDQLLLDTKQKPDDVLETLIEKDSYFRVEKFLPNCIDRISDESLHKVPASFLYTKLLFDLLIQEDRIQRASNQQLYNIHVMGKRLLDPNDPLAFKTSVELFIRKLPHDPTPLFQIVLKTEQKERIDSEIKSTLKDRAWVRRRHAIAWRDQIDAENN